MEYGRQLYLFRLGDEMPLRNKANFGVLEGLLTTLLNEKIVIQKLLENESNQEDEYDKYNRVDILAENSRGEHVIIEV